MKTFSQHTKLIDAIAYNNLNKMKYFVMPYNRKKLVFDVSNDHLGHITYTAFKKTEPLYSTRVVFSTKDTIGEVIERGELRTAHTNPELEEFPDT